MTCKKKLAIWLAAMTIVFLIVNTAGTLFIRHFISDTLSKAVCGYSKRAERMLYPEKAAEGNENPERSISGLLGLRSLLNDNVINNQPGFLYYFLFMNFDVDETWVFFDENGMSELSSGIYARVYKQDALTGSFGLLNVRELCENAETKAFYNVLEEHPEATIRLDAYTQIGNTVKPLQLTLLDDSGSELYSAAFTNHTGDKMINTDDTFIYNGDSTNLSTSNRLYEKMRIAYSGERKSDRKAAEVAAAFSFSGEDIQKDTYSYGLGNMIVTHIENTGGYASVTVHHYHYMGDVICCTILLGTITTVILLIVFRKRRSIA